jgi:hypothetical protein
MHTGADGRADIRDGDREVKASAKQLIPDVRGKHMQPLIRAILDPAKHSPKDAH